MTETATAVELKTFADFEAILATALPGYEPRSGQQRLAEAIEKTMAAQLAAKHQVVIRSLGEPFTPTHLLANAPTGTGKSMAYLAPAIMLVQQNKKVLVSVTTKALQSQLAGKDVPFLQTHMPTQFTWTLLQGRGNYYCGNCAVSSENPEGLSTWGQVKDYAEAHPEWSGLRADLPFALPDIEWMSMRADSDGCQECDCRDDGLDTPCYATRALRKANECDLVIVNHSLLCTWLQMRQMKIQTLLDAFDYVVLDEAHELPDSASSTLGFQLTERAFTSLTSMLYTFAQGYSTNVDNFPLTERTAAVNNATTDLFQALASLETDLKDRRTEAMVPIRDREQGTKLRLKNEQITETSDQFVALNDALADLEETWDQLKFEYTDSRTWKRKLRISSRLRGLTQRLQAIATDDQFETVRWVTSEKTRKGEFRLLVEASPVIVGPWLEKLLWNTVSTILVSATLVVDGGFDFMAKELGIKNAWTLQVPSPFDFTTQAMLYVPETMPIPRGADLPMFETQSVEEIVRLINDSRGRTMVLFTSTKRMNKVAKLIRDMHRIPYTLLVQGELPHGELSKRFVEDTSSVLFGLKSFMTGVDFQGETLTTLIVEKLMFAVPNEPTVEARCERIEKVDREQPFFSFTLPAMCLVLQQAVGRLIRHTSDRGVIVCLDRRLVQGKYAAQLQRDLPPAARATDYTDVAAFLSTC